MKFVIGSVIAFFLVAIWSCLIAASDSDDAAGYDDIMEDQ